jgi:hypothetical protein
MNKLAGCVAALAAMLSAVDASAQSAGGDLSGDSTGGTGTQRQHRHGQNGTKQPQTRPAVDVPVMKDAWPRLDPGAVFCQTPEDLRAHLANVSARLDGKPASADPPGCHVVREPTAVVVVSREGLARTEVRMSDATGAVGWTDTYLPDKAAP